MSNQQTTPDPRDHGFPNNYEILSTPEVLRDLPQSECPLCGCSKTYGITLRTHTEGIGDCNSFYRGCAACEWASSMDSIPNNGPRREADSDYPFERLN